MPSANWLSPVDHFYVRNHFVLANFLLLAVSFILSIAVFQSWQSLLYCQQQYSSAGSLFCIASSSIPVLAVSFVLPAAAFECWQSLLYCQQQYSRAGSLFCITSSSIPVLAVSFVLPAAVFQCWQSLLYYQEQYSRAGSLFCIASSSIPVLAVSFILPAAVFQCWQSSLWDFLQDPERGPTSPWGWLLMCADVFLLAVCFNFLLSCLLAISWFGGVTTLASLLMSRFYLIYDFLKPLTSLPLILSECLAVHHGHHENGSCLKTGQHFIFVIIYLLLPINCIILDSVSKILFNLFIANNNNYDSNNENIAP